MCSFICELGLVRGVRTKDLTGVYLLRCQLKKEEALHFVTVFSNVCPPFFRDALKPGDHLLTCAKLLAVSDLISVREVHELRVHPRSCLLRD